MTKARVSHFERRGAKRSWRDEGGSILIPVAIALLGLLAFSAFTIDNGVMLSSRREAQNSADSAALAAALYLAWDAPNDQAGAQATAVAAAQQHAVWGNQPDVTLADVTFPPCPPGAPGLADVCVRVDVFRNQRAGGDPLPAFFAMLAGVTDQGVQATATAQVLYSTGADDCLLPFAIPDYYVEIREDWQVDPPDPIWGDAEDDDPDPGSPYNSYPYDSFDYLGQGEIVTDWDAGDFFDVVEMQGQQGADPLNGAVDRYEEGPWSPATALDSGPTGFNGALHYGMQQVIKQEQGGQIAPSYYYPIVLPDGLGTGMAQLRTRVQGCTGPYNPPVGPGTIFQVEPGNMGNPIRTEIQAIVDSDLGAFWDPTMSAERCVDANCGLQITVPGGVNSPCAANGTCTGGNPFRSPRHRAIAIFDPHNYMEGHRTGRGDVLITGVVGLFLEQPNGQEIVGRLTTWNPEPGSGTLTDNRSSFLRSVILVR
jgi:Flp pilus assembly protein TadG